MKTLTIESTNGILFDFALSCEEMINVRGGGEGEPISDPNMPPVKI